MNLTMLQDNRDFRNNFGLSEAEELLYCRDTSFFNTRDQGMVVTDWGFHCIPDNDNPDEKIEFSWEDVENVEFKDEIYIFWGYGDKTEDNRILIHSSYFSKSTPSNWQCQSLAKNFNRVFDTVKPADHPVDAAIAKMHDTENPKEIERIGREMLGKYPEFDYMINYELGINAYIRYKDLDMAYTLLSKSLAAEENDDYFRQTWSHYILSSILVQKEDWRNPELRYHTHRASIGNPECKYGDTILVEDSTKDLADIEKRLADEGYEGIPYEQHKIILPVNKLTELSQINQEQIRPVLLSAIRNSEKFSFPIGHPIANTLYVCHPYIQTKYIPFENYEIELIEDKLREFSIIAQALGASEISVKVESNTTEEENRKKNTNLNGKAESLYGEANGSASGASSSNVVSKWEHTFNRKQILKPSRTPYVPEGLVWLSGEPDWQRLIEQRRNGSLQYHHESWSTKKTRIISGHAESMFKAELKSLYGDLGVDWSEAEDYFSSQENNLSLSIDVSFGTPDGEQQAKSSNALTQNEQEYINEYRECFVDGEISASERRLLSKLGIRLGLSEARIKELEQSIQPKLSPEEEEYLAEYRECIADDPEISPSTRRLLGRLAKSLNLTEEQINKLEKI